nr:MAG TPA: hypothetical protein [Caudoviricetes sp.]
MPTRSSVQLVAPTHLLLSARKLYAYFCYFIPKNNYHYLVLSTGNINLKVINALNDIHLVLSTGYISGSKA